MNKGFSIALALGAALLSAHAFAAGPSHMSSEILGCQHSKTYSKILQIVAQKDRAAAVKLINADVYIGECVQLKKGESVYPTDVKTVNGFVLRKVRPAGKTTEYWTLAKTITE